MARPKNSRLSEREYVTEKVDYERKNLTWLIKPFDVDGDLVNGFTGADEAKAFCSERYHYGWAVSAKDSETGASVQISCEPEEVHKVVALLTAKRKKAYLEKIGENFALEAYELQFSRVNRAFFSKVYHYIGGELVPLF